jgi:hypothetical protein
MRTAAGWLIVLLFVLTGCAAGTVNYRDLASGTPPALAADMAIVFGRIVFIENGRSKLPYTLGKPVWHLMEERAAGAPASGPPPHQLALLSTGEDGLFVYAIPAGRYRITSVVPFYYTPPIDPALAFDASTPGHAYYLGDLVIAYEASSWLGGLWGNYIERLTRLEVRDRFGATHATARRLLPPEVTVERQLLSRVRGAFPSLPAAGGGSGAGITPGGPADETPGAAQ